MNTCERTVYARELCASHYQRERAYGDAEHVPVRRRAGEAARFWSKVDKTETCWLWTGGKSASGYGKFWADDGRSLRAHRWSYVQAKGAIPKELQLDHLCRTPACVRPDHLEAVTPRVNTMRGEGPAAANAVKTECPKGHPYDDENTYHMPPSRTLPNGGRGCRACRREAYLRWVERGKAQAGR